MIKSYCTQNDGDCLTCSLTNYGRDCKNNELDVEHLAAVALGRKGGRSTSPAKQAAVRENGKKGGRPREKTWYVADDIGHIAGHDMHEIGARGLAEQMKSEEPGAGWEALNESE